MWTAEQKREIAKLIIRNDFGTAALPYLTRKVRDALVADYVLHVVVGQVTDAVKVDDVSDLLSGVRQEICNRLGEGFFG